MSVIGVIGLVLVALIVIELIITHIKEFVFMCYLIYPTVIWSIATDITEPIAGLGGSLQWIIFGLILSLGYSKIHISEKVYEWLTIVFPHGISAYSLLFYTRDLVATIPLLVTTTILLILVLSGKIKKYLEKR